MIDCLPMIMSDIKISPVNTEDRKKLDIRAGDTVRVWQKIKEGEKFRLQAFEGLIIARKHGTEAGGTFTVRNVSSGVGTEKIFPLYSPMIDKIEVIKRSRVRRAKLYHIKYKAAKEIRRQMRNIRAIPEVEAEIVPTENEQKGEEKKEEGAQEPTK